ncbi:MAG TPA: ATP-binding protein, partial [Planctomycetota bacterium]|nr:ATP-binding protein [Planctomycetota bacterium]
MIRRLAPEELRWTLRGDRAIRAALGEGRRARDRGPAAIGQERAIAALDLGLGIRERGYNIVAVGPPGTGRTSTVLRLVRERARREPTPGDLVLLSNFDDRDRPHTVTLPPGMGPVVEDVYFELVMRLLVELESAFESDAYVARRQELEATRERRLQAALARVDPDARRRGLIVRRAGAAVTLSPADEGGRPLTDAQFESLPARARRAFDRAAAAFRPRLEEAVRRLRAIEKDADAALERFATGTARAIAAPLFEGAREALAGQKRVIAHLAELHEDILDGLERLFPQAWGPQDEAAKKKRQRDPEDESPLLRYRVNVLVTHEPGSGAPVVHETHPTLANLVGRIEQRQRGGETVTDFTRIRAGTLHRANGGYLVLDAEELLREGPAWEALRRALRHRAIDLDDPGEPGRLVTAAALRPEPVPLALKVCLVGAPESVASLAADPGFAKLFKVKAEFGTDAERTPA